LINILTPLQLVLLATSPTYSALVLTNSPSGLPVVGGGELERALDDATGIGSTVQSFSDCRESIRKQILPSCRKIFGPHFMFVWFRGSEET